MEEDFQDSKQATALDGTQVRGYRPRERHITLVMAAYEHTPPADCGMIALTAPELQRLLPLLLPGNTHRSTDNTFRLHSGQSGGVATRPAPAGTTAGDAMHSRHDDASDCERQLEY